MSFNAYITGYVNQIRQDLIQHGYIVPKPEGVRVNYIGKSLVNFKPYSGMIVSMAKSETINMSYDPKELISFKQNPYFIVQGITKSTIEMKGVEEIGSV